MSSLVQTEHLFHDQINWFFQLLINQRIGPINKGN